MQQSGGKLFNDHFINQVYMDIVVELQEGAIIRVTDVTPFKADMSAMKGIPRLSVAAIQKAVFACLKAAAGRLSCSLAWCV